MNGNNIWDIVFRKINNTLWVKSARKANERAILPRFAPEYVKEYCLFVDSDLGVVIDSCLEDLVDATKYPNNADDYPRMLQLGNGDWLISDFIPEPNTKKIDPYYYDTMVNHALDLARSLGLDDPWLIEKFVYAQTECGASIIFYKDHIILSSIVEGVDAEVPPHQLNYPFPIDEFWDTLKSVEEWAADIWNRTHGCLDCGEEDEDGYIYVNPECPTCKGEGRII